MAVPGLIYPRSRTTFLTVVGSPTVGPVGWNLLLAPNKLRRSWSITAGADSLIEWGDKDDIPLLKGIRIVGSNYAASQGVVGFPDHWEDRHSTWTGALYLVYYSILIPTTQPYIAAIREDWIERGV